ncbi:MAG: radical SAM protein [Magnetococcales bacterium]|nr:radical SAM protein [Magnetococcales bacterium]
MNIPHYNYAPCATDDLIINTNNYEYHDFDNKNKILKHLDRVYQWYTTGFIYPITVNLDFTNVCNHRCPECLSNAQAGTPDRATIPYERVVELVDEFVEMGVKSVGMGAGGDPTCYPYLEQALRYINSKGIQISMSTNGSNMSPTLIEAIVNCCTWVRISLDADTEEMYKLTHGVGTRIFKRTLANISQLVNLKRQCNSEIVLSTCFLIGPHTFRGIYGAAKLSKDLGVNHIRIRPFFTWERDKSSYTSTLSDQIYKELEKAKGLEDSDFHVSYPIKRTNDVLNGGNRNYSRCHVHHFQVSITADQKVYICCFLIDKEKYCLGDLKEQPFRNIWRSERRRQVFNNIDLSDCPNPCRFYNSNEFLEAVVTPVIHQNFI